MSDLKTLKKLSNTRYYTKHKDTLNLERRKKYAESPEENLATQHESYLRNRDKRLADARRWYDQNRAAINAKQRMRWATDEEYRQTVKAKNTASRHGISVEEYLEMYKQADGKCAICGIRPTGRSLHVDHDHKTGSVRGLLCHHCNTAIGLLREDASIINNALKYLGNNS